LRSSRRTIWPFYAPLSFLLLVGVAVWGCGSSERPSPVATETPTPSLTQADEGQGGVVFQATALTSSQMAERGHPPDHVGFLVQLDTHSGSLLSYDLTAQAALRDGGGHEAQALGWEPQSEDSHHRSGLLYFPLSQAMVTSEALYMEISLRDLGGVPERVLRWEPPPPPFQGSSSVSSAGER